MWPPRRWLEHPQQQWSWGPPGQDGEQMVAPVATQEAGKMPSVAMLAAGPPTKKICERRGETPMATQKMVEKYSVNRERTAGITAIAGPVVSCGRSDSLRLYVLILWRQHIFLLSF